MIDKLRLKNFTAFDEVEIDFSPRINVIVGENGTGKTHLLKAAYAVCAGNNSYVDKAKVSKATIQDEFSKKLSRVFMHGGGKVGKLSRDGAETDSEIEATVFGGKTLLTTFSSRSTKVKLTKKEAYETYSWNPLFLPSKETLSFFDGVTSKESDPETIDRLFNDCYLDLIRKLGVEAKELNPEILQHPRLGILIKRITNAIGGYYRVQEGKLVFRAGEFKDFRVKEQNKLGDKVETKFTPASKGGDFSNTLTAEGFRKIGVLQHLLLNQQLLPGVTGSLFWDEPEANLNPRLMRTIVEVLIQLSRNSQQVILATHDYVLLKWFDLLTDSTKEDHVRFHVVHRENEIGNVQCDSFDSYDDVTPNAIDETFGALTDEEIAASMGGLGK